MLNRQKHQLIMGRILRDIFSDVSIAPLIGFIGGTCAYLFYKLPRFSVDLDFDLLNDSPIEKVKDNQILHGIGELLSAQEKLWVKANLKKEVIFLLKNYATVLSDLEGPGKKIL